MICIYVICLSHAKSFARIESNWTFREGVSSLISNISFSRQSILLLHLRTEFVEIFRDSRVCPYNVCQRERTYSGAHSRSDVSALMYNPRNLHHTSHIEKNKLLTVGLQ